MKIMPFRYEEIEKTIDGLQATDVPLVAMDTSGFHSAGLSDNNGIYYFTSMIAKHFNLSADSAIDYFFFIGIALCTSLAIISFLFLFSHWLSKIASSLVCIGFSYNCAVSCSDIYIAYFLSISATIPLFILIKNRSCQSRGLWILAIAFSGLVIGYCNFIREYAGTTAFIFIALWVVLYQALNKIDKVLYLCLLFIFSLIPYAHENYLEKKRDTFLVQYQSAPSPSFPTWHLLYIGLGHFENNYGILRKDESGIEKAQSIQPNVLYLSKEYNEILKSVYLSIVRSDPWFVLKTYFIKLLISCWLVIKYTNFGLILCFYVRPSWRESLAFLTSGAFGVLPAIAVVPWPHYCLGTLSLGVFFGVYMIGMSIEKFRKNSRGIFSKPKFLPSVTANLANKLFKKKGF